MSKMNFMKDLSQSDNLMREINNQILSDEKFLVKRKDRFEMPSVLETSQKFDKIRENLYRKGKASVPHFGVLAVENFSNNSDLIELAEPNIEKRMKEY